MNKICNLNILVKKKGVEISQILGFLSSATLSSYLTNKDAEGVYFSHTKRLVKGEDKINMCRYFKSIKKSNFVMTHQRISTSGKTKKYAQPFRCEDNDFVLMHNGIIDEFQEGEHSDTYGYFYNYFLVKFNELKGSREKRIIRAIKETLTGCNGSYSIAIYDTKRKVMYYFKDKNRYIYFYKSDDDKLLYITTKDANKIYLNFFDRNFSEMTIQDYGIYKITVGKKIEIKNVGKIPLEPEKRFKSYKNRQTVDGGYGDRGCGYHNDMRQHDIINQNNYWDKRNMRLLTKNKNAVRDIFGEGKDIEDKSGKLSHQFNEIFTNKNTRNIRLEDMLLEEMLENGETLRDMGFTKNFTEDVCQNCYQYEGIFNDDRNNKICRNCVEDIRDTLIEDMIDSDRHIAYMGVGEFEDF